MSSSVKKWIDILLYLILIFSPLAYGSVHQPSFAFVFLIISFLFILNFSSNPQTIKEFLSLPLSLLGLSFLFILIFQLIPLPSSILRLISPNTYHTLVQFSLSKKITWHPLTIYPWATLREFLKVLAYGMLYLVILKRTVNSFQWEKEIPTNFLKLTCLCALLGFILQNFFAFNFHIPADAIYFTIIIALLSALIYFPQHSDYIFIKKISHWIAIMGITISIFAIIQKFSYNGRIFWIGKKAVSGFGPFISYNLYTGFMELCAPFSLCFCLTYLINYKGSLQGIKNKIIWLFSSQTNKAFFYLAGFVIIISSVFLSTSRAGSAAVVISTLIFFIILITKLQSKKRIRVLYGFLIILLLLSIAVVFTSPTFLLEKYQRLTRIKGKPISKALVRFNIWHDCISLYKDFPLLGTGWGTFCHIYPKYRTLKMKKFARYAENDYIQTITELGAIGVIFNLIFFLIYLRLWSLLLKKWK